jgi:hypothetical protein
MIAARFTIVPQIRIRQEGNEGVREKSFGSKQIVPGICQQAVREGSPGDCWGEGSEQVMMQAIKT